MRALQLSSDGLEVVNAIVIDDSSDPADFGAIAAPSEEIQIGWVKSGSSWTAPPQPAPTKDELRAHANMRQWSLATGGFTIAIDGTARTFVTDSEALSLMSGKVQRLAMPGAPSSVTWQFGADFVPVSAADFSAAAVAVADFVQSTFDSLALVFAGIEDGSIASFEDIAGFAWPSNHG